MVKTIATHIPGMDDAENALLAKMDAALGQERQEAQAERKSQEEMTGDFVELDHGFWGKAMKLREQRLMVRKLKAASSDEASDEEDEFSLLVALLECVLYKPDANEEDGFRHATEAEVEKHFDAEEGKAIINRFTGLNLGQDDTKNA